MRTVIPSQYDMTLNMDQLLLVKYAERMGYPEELFFGLDQTRLSGMCSEIITKTQRDKILTSLRQSTDIIGKYLGAPILPTWIANEAHNITSQPIRANKMNVVEMGSRLVSTPAELTVDYDADPAYVEITSELPSDDIYLFYPGTQIEITPSLVEEIDGGYKIFIPWARLVAKDKQENPVAGWAYLPTYMDDVYTETVAWSSITTSGAGAVFLKKNCASCGYEEVAVDCSSIIYSQSGIIEVRGVSHRQYRNVLLNYKTWRVPDDAIWDAVIHLAHSLMTTEPGMCDLLRYQWERDRSESLNSSGRCPFGESDGAWKAWVSVMAQRNLRSTLI